MNGTSFQHQVLRIVEVQTQAVAECAGQFIVLFPVGIQTVQYTTPGIELPVDPADGFSVGDKGGRRISCPG